MQIDSLCNNRLCLNACKNCSGVYCCGVLERGGTIELPFLTAYDISLIKSFTGMSPDRFCESVVNPATDNNVFLLRTMKTACMFFAPAEGKCRIHAVRPLDCRLFPLDIEKIGEELRWIIYDYKYCCIDDDDLKSLLSYRDRAVSILAEDLQDYATFPIPGMKKLPRKIIGKVRFPNECLR